MATTTNLFAARMASIAYKGTVGNFHPSLTYVGEGGAYMRGAHAWLLACPQIID